MSEEERIASFWAAADRHESGDLRGRLEGVLAGRDDAIALFERASLEDFLGAEHAAIPHYRAALERGLAQPRRTQAVIQLASSLRNVGDHSAAIALLTGIAADDPLHEPAQAFLALALLDDGKPAPAVRTALRALAPHLPEYGRAVAAYADAAVTPEHVRNVVVVLIVKDGWVLAEEYAATVDHGVFLRAPGGGLEFGETVDEAVRREIREELDATLDELRLVTVTENIWDGARKRGHEIVHVFAARSAELEALPRGDRVRVIDGDTTVGWYDLAALRRQGPPLYPAGILEVAASLAGGASGSGGDVRQGG